jgi:hypothetical protein
MSEREPVPAVGYWIVYAVTALFWFLVGLWLCRLYFCACE